MGALKKLGLVSLAVLAPQAHAINVDLGKVDPGLQGDNASADVTIQKYINNALVFLGLLAVIYALWGGFNILTAAGDEDKVKKGKTILIQAAIGIVVIFLAYSFVKLIIGSIVGSGTGA